MTATTTTAARRTPRILDAAAASWCDQHGIQYVVHTQGVIAAMTDAEHMAWGDAFTAAENAAATPAPLPTPAAVVPTAPVVVPTHHVPELDTLPTLGAARLTQLCNEHRLYIPIGAGVSALCRVLRLHVHTCNVAAAAPKLVPETPAAANVAAGPTAKTAQLPLPAVQHVVPPSVVKCMTECVAVLDRASAEANAVLADMRCKVETAAALEKLLRMAGKVEAVVKAVVAVMVATVETPVVPETPKSTFPTPKTPKPAPATPAVAPEKVAAANVATAPIAATTPATPAVSDKPAAPVVDKLAVEKAANVADARRITSVKLAVKANTKLVALLVTAILDAADAADCHDVPAVRLAVDAAMAQVAADDAEEKSLELLAMYEAGIAK